MEKTNGIFDNRAQMQREAWMDGQIIGVWPAAKCGTGLDTLLPWEREALEQHWGAYPNPPPRDT